MNSRRVNPDSSVIHLLLSMTRTTAQPDNRTTAQPANRPTGQPANRPAKFI
jgi:hypothetical protein